MSGLSTQHSTSIDYWRMHRSHKYVCMCTCATLGSILLASIVLVLFNPTGHVSVRNITLGMAPFNKTIVLTAVMLALVTAAHVIHFITTTGIQTGILARSHRTSVLCALGLVLLIANVFIVHACLKHPDSPFLLVGKLAVVLFFSVASNCIYALSGSVCCQDAASRSVIASAIILAMCFVVFNICWVARFVSSTVTAPG